MFFDRRIVVVFVCLLALIQTAQSFQNDSTKELVIRVNVQLVQVDATVTNSRDEPVTDLKAEDFLILQDGKPQEITNFSFIRTRDARTVLKPAIIPKPSNVPPPPPPPLKREKVRRTIALVVDDFGLSFESMTPVRRAIQKWIEEEMQPDDLVALVLTGGGEGALQQFTNDKRLLSAAVNRIQYNVASRVGVTSLSGISSSSSSTSTGGFETANPKQERDLVYTTFSLQSVQDVVNGLKNLPGRKDLILFSESLKIMYENGPGVSQGRDVRMKELLQNTVDLANKWAVVIHSIDPRGTMGLVSAEDSFSGMEPADIAAVSGQRSSQLTNSRDGMAQLAQETGGLLLANQNNIDKALEKVVDEGDGYYLIGYQPDETTISEMKTGNAKYHNIQLRVKRSGLHVRTRSRFFSTPENISPPDIMSRQERIEEAMRSPFSSGSLRVRLTALFSETKKDFPCINALLHFSTGQLSFTDEPDGWHKAVVEIVAGLYDVSGQQVEFADRQWSITVKNKSYDQLKKHGASFLVRLPVRQPGSYQMRLVLRDIRNGQLGNATQFVEVPDVRKNKLALSGIVLAADQSTAKGPEDQTEGMLDDSGSNGTAAVRIFEPGSSISWAYQILNAKNGKDEKPKLMMQLRLFHEGQEVYERKLPEMTVVAKGNSKRMIAADCLKLVQLPPGYYVLQVAVTDTLAEERDQMAVQSIDFEVQKTTAGGKPTLAF
jgi:VWFA-related protein